MVENQGKEDIQVLLSNIVKMIHDPKVRDNIVETLSKGNLVEGVANISSAILIKIEGASNTKFPPQMTAQMLMYIIKELLELAEMANLLRVDDVSTDARKNMLQLAANKVDEQGQQGQAQQGPQEPPQQALGGGGIPQPGQVPQQAQQQATQPQIQPQQPQALGGM